MIHLHGNFEIGRFLHLTSEIRNFELDAGRPALQSNSSFRISDDFGFEMQESSNFKVRILGWMFI
jgi:hypothetical protein